MERLPLLPNGKVDRSALPAPDADGPDTSEARVPPRNALEEVLARIWAEILDVQRVGVHDDFFALGGHSLLAMRAMFRVTDTLRVEAPLRDLFRAPTVSGLAAALLQAAGDQVAVLEKTAELVLRVADLPEEHVDGLLEGSPAGNSDEAAP